MSQNDLPLSVGELSVPRYPEFNDAERFRDEARALVITDGKGFNEASHRLATIRAMKDSLASEKRRYLGPFNEGIARLRDWFKPAETALSDAELAVNREMSRFALEDQRRVREAEAEAARLAEKERKNLDKRADKAEAKGNVEQAELLRETAAVGVVPVKVESVAQSEAVAQRTIYKGRVINMKMLLKAVLDGKVPLSVLKVDETGLNRLIQATKGEVSYPGVEIYQDVQFRRASK